MIDNNSLPRIGNKIITAQGYELVRDRIGEILVIEIRNQERLRDIAQRKYATVFSERITPFQDEEATMINVMLDGVDYSGFTETNVHGQTRYYIDVYTTGKTNQSTHGGYNSAANLHQYLGWCRYILQSTFYKTLCFSRGLVLGTYVENLQISDPQGNQDASFGTMGRLTFRVRIDEHQESWQPTELKGNTTGVLLAETQKGYQYILES